MKCPKCNYEMTSSPLEEAYIRYKKGCRGLFKRYAQANGSPSPVLQAEHDRRRAVISALEAALEIEQRK